jgi:hypothetical protein
MNNGRNPMDAAVPIATLDLRLYPLLVAPGALACWLLGVALDVNGWLYGLLAMLGWLLGSLIWWRLYRQFMLERRPPSRVRFYVWCVLMELGGAAAITAYAMTSAA